MMFVQVLVFFLFSCTISAIGFLEKQEYAVITGSLKENCSSSIYTIGAVPLTKQESKDVCKDPPVSCFKGNISQSDVWISAFCTKDLTSVVKTAFPSKLYYGLASFSGTKCKVSQLISVVFVLADGKTCLPAVGSSAPWGQKIRINENKTVSVETFSSVDCSSRDNVTNTSVPQEIDKCTPLGPFLIKDNSFMIISPDNLKALERKSFLQW